MTFENFEEFVDNSFPGNLNNAIFGISGSSFDTRIKIALYLDSQKDIPAVSLSRMCIDLKMDGSSLLYHLDKMVNSGLLFHYYTNIQEEPVKNEDTGIRSRGKSSFYGLSEFGKKFLETLAISLLISRENELDLKGVSDAIEALRSENSLHQSLDKLLLEVQPGLSDIMVAIADKINLGIIIIIDDYEELNKESIPFVELTKSINEKSSQKFENSLIVYHLKKLIAGGLLINNNVKSSSRYSSFYKTTNLCKNLMYSLLTLLGPTVIEEVSKGIINVPPDISISTPMNEHMQIPQYQHIPDLDFKRLPLPLDLSISIMSFRGTAPANKLDSHDLMLDAISEREKTNEISLANKDKFFEDLERRINNIETQDIEKGPYLRALQNDLSNGEFLIKGLKMMIDVSLQDFAHKKKTLLNMLDEIESDQSGAYTESQKKKLLEKD